MKALDQYITLIKYIVVYFVLTYVGGFLAEVIHLYVAAIIKPEEGSTALLYYFMASGILIAQIVIIYLFLKKKWASLSVGVIRSSDWVLVFLLLVVMLIGLLPVDALVSNNVPMDNEMLVFIQNITKTPLGLVLGIFISPFSEELLFRGAILRFLLQWSKRPWVAILVSSIMFGAMHGNWEQGIAGFIIGVLLGWLAYRTGSIIPGIILHILNNGMAFIEDHYFPNLDQSVYFSTPYIYVILGISCVVMAAAIYLMNKVVARIPHDHSVDS